MSRRAGDDIERALAELPPCETGEVTVEPASDRAAGSPEPSPEPPIDPSLASIEPSIDGLPDRFEVRRVVGRGGMGAVVAAYDRALGREVAIKVLRLDHTDARTRQRFLREARAAASLRDRSIVQVHDIDADGRYIVMELVHGESLAARLEREHRLPADEVSRIGRALAGALGVAHAAGIVHRDVKPANLLLDQAGDVKLADFGVALFADSELTAPGVQVGTPAYMAPEQLRGQDTDARADVYAAGATLYRAATGVGLHDRGRRDVAADVVEATGDRALADVIARAVRDDPAERFADGRALRTALASRRRTPTSGIVVGMIALIAIGVGALYVVRGRATTPAGTSSTEIGPIAVAPIRSRTWSYAAQPPDPTAMGDVLSIVLGDIDGIRATGASELASAGARANDSSWSRAARALDARYLVRGAILQHGARFHASIEVVEVLEATTSPVSRIELDGAAIPPLLDDVAEHVARTFDPHKTLNRGTARQRARELFARGEPKLARLDFSQARPFLDQAVDADPSYFDAWFALASARSWMMAPEAEVREAIEAAYDKASPGPRKQLLEGASRYMHHDYAGARQVLEPLVADAKLPRFEQRDALYYLGEANWHDGRYAIASGYFGRALELDGRFKPSAIHLGEYALARRDHALAVYLGGLLEQPNQDPFEFMQGDYETLARTSKTRWRLFALLALGREPTPDDDALVEGDGAIYRIARALGQGDTATARSEIDAWWKPIESNSRDEPIADSTYLEIKTLADVLLCAGEVAPLRRAVTFMAEHSKPTSSPAQPVYGYQRISILAAPLVGDRTWIVRDGLTERDARLADAIEAEMTGDRRRAADLLAAIVADPSASWDYPERVALLRNLRALGRTADARALCDDTLRPAIFTWAYLPTRRHCRSR